MVNNNSSGNSESRPPAKPVALITGAGSGIGRQLAIDLAKEDWAVSAVDLHEEALEKLAAELAGKAFAWATADVTDRVALGNAVADLEEKQGPVDLLIASAGVGFETSALAYSAQDIETIIRVNLIGVSNSIGAVLPGMIERQRGHLVALSSLASYRGIPRMAGYCASKSGVSALMEAIRVEVKPLGIAVTTICPGWIHTAMTADLDLRDQPVMAVDVAARQIRQAIRRRLPVYAFPSGAARRLGFIRWLPPSLSDWLLARVLGPLPEKKSEVKSTLPQETPMVPR
jgi:short-subunit dehydrogenase